MSAGVVDFAFWLLVWALGNMVAFALVVALREAGATRTLAEWVEVAALSCALLWIAVALFLWALVEYTS